MKSAFTKHFFGGSFVMTNWQPALSSQIWDEGSLMLTSSHMGNFRGPLLPGGGYSLYDGWYICAAVLTPFFYPLGTKLDLFGVFFLIHQHKNDLLGTNPHKIWSFWPQNTIFPSIFWGPIFSGPRHTPSNFLTEYPPPPPRATSPITIWHLS